jgi:hypothetical protein
LKLSKKKDKKETIFHVDVILKIIGFHGITLARRTNINILTTYYVKIT